MGFRLAADFQLKEVQLEDNIHAPPISVYWVFTQYDPPRVQTWKYALFKFCSRCWPSRVA